MIVEGSGYAAFSAPALSTHAAEFSVDNADELVVEHHHHLFVDSVEHEPGLDPSLADFSIVTSCGGTEDSNRKGHSRRHRRFTELLGRKMTMDELIGLLGEEQESDEPSTDTAPVIATSAWPSSFRILCTPHRRLRQNVTRMLTRSLNASTLMTASLFSTVAVRLLQSRAGHGHEERRSSGLNIRGGARSNIERRRFPRS